MSGSTPNYNFTLPTVTGDTGAWGGYLNTNFTSLDTILYGVANPASLTVSSTPGTSVKGTVTFQNISAPTGQKTRWILAEDTVAESGGNAGSNLSLQAYSDTGSLIFTPIGITRSTGAVTFGSPVTLTSGLVGVATNSNAAAGQIGEYLTSSVALGSAIALVSGTGAQITSLTLTSGDWDVCGLVQFTSTGGSPGSTLVGSTSTTSAATGPNWTSSSLLATGSGGVATGTSRVSIASSTVVYLNGFAVFSGGTVSAYGTISARRAR